MKIGTVFNRFSRQQVDSSAAGSTQSKSPSKLGALGQKLKKFFQSSSSQSSPRATNFNDLSLDIKGVNCC